MKIENGVYRLLSGRGTTWLERMAGPLVTAIGADRYPQRLAIVDADSSGFTVEATVVHCLPDD